MNDEMKQAIKEYLIENLTIENDVLSDIYEINPDQVTLTVKLEGDIVAQTVINPLPSFPEEN